MPPGSPNSSRDLFPGHGAGKGDAERSPGWRDNYDEILFPKHLPGQDGFIQKSLGRKVKRYGAPPPAEGITSQSL